MNILALIEAGNVKEDDDILATMQNVSEEHAQQICEWLTLATGTATRLRHIGFGGSKEYFCSPMQLAAEMEAQRRDAEAAI